MKLSKAQNPYGVQAGQVWKATDRRRQKKFVVKQIEKAQDGIFAVAEYGKGKNLFNRCINLLRFDRYVRVK